MLAPSPTPWGSPRLAGMVVAAPSPVQQLPRGEKTAFCEVEPAQRNLLLVDSCCPGPGSCPPALLTRHCLGKGNGGCPPSTPCSGQVGATSGYWGCIAAVEPSSILLPLQGSSWAAESFPHPQLCRCLFVFWQKPLCLFIAVEAPSRSLHVPCVRLAGNVMRAGNPAGPGISPAGQRGPNSSFRGLLSRDCSSGRARLRGSWSPPQTPLLHWQRSCTLPQVE